MYKGIESLENLKKMQSIDVLTQMGIRKVVRFIWSAILDKQTCPLCQSLDGKVSGVNDSAYNIYQPPLHGSCRCLLDNKTPIYTVNGWKPFYKINLGDLVLTHRKRFRKVIAIFTSPNYREGVIRIITEGTPFGIKGGLLLTPEHPVLKKGVWTEVKDIKIGDKILTLIEFVENDGFDLKENKIIDIIKVSDKEVRTRYNFDVADDNSYIAKGVVVHNCTWIGVTSFDKNIPPVNWKPPKSELVKNFASGFLGLPEKEIVVEKVLPIKKREEKISKPSETVDISED